ncbi:MAG TPA: nucleoside triphosphate pyrophosphohydrolase [Dictyoglomaceae bacterium]|nr:nucleoside triphosphate pyrophosphohydrolase [Dictyoglomaceae bacterium]HOL39154.1 nucleoside triphosphate pyrophosphohydrolase [Dictyoglomaceae bacterium]HOP94237.1 nucleoside triphosphate pyrophosphohydrolase [Dictyoglomaceae bacterium]HPP15308.1 nucleoside triphosphate pyrophosphohydrolase [Dictyoglomaceae bacterium]HPU42714.1 nucleoside triphosphate pyrophosphohydrolase [Dictyoglomaceae bacterium]
MDNKEKISKEFIDLFSVVEKVRKECPWDQEQTPQSLAPYFLEESYELIEGLEENDAQKIREELGDVLLHILMQSIMAAEEDRFSFADVCRDLKNKLIIRHPHVFGDIKVKEVKDILTNWETIKSSEDNGKGILDGIPNNMPALLSSFRIQEKVSHVGFDWKETTDVIPKIYEEIKELEEAIETSEKEKIEEEIGDLLFSIVNIARHLDIEPESALRKTNRKFIKRFKFIEEKVKESGKNWKDLNLEDLDQLWELSKTS